MNPQEPITPSPVASPTTQAPPAGPVYTGPFPTQQPPRKKRRLLIIIASIVALALIISGTIFGLSLIKQGTQPIETKNTTPLPASPTKTVSNSTEYKKGDNKVRFGHFELTVNSTERGYTIEDDKKQPGLENIVINFTVKNIDESIYSINDTDLVIQDDNGNYITHSITKIVKPPFVTTNVKPDVSVSGNLLYEVPNDQSDLKIYYITQIYNDDKKKFENQEFLLPF